MCCRKRKKENDTHIQIIFLGFLAIKHTPKREEKVCVFTHPGEILDNNINAYVSLCMYVSCTISVKDKKRGRKIQKKRI